jgi:hypothetical protein
MIGQCIKPHLQQDRPDIVINYGCKTGIRSVRRRIGMRSGLLAADSMEKSARSLIWMPDVVGSNLTSVTARMALNYKEIPYRTEWLRFDEVGEKIKAL